MQSLTRSQFFLQYNFKYINISTFVVFQNLTMAKLTPEEKAQLKSKVKLLEPMNMDLGHSWLPISVWWLHFN